MANRRTAGTWYVDTTGAVTTDKGLRIAYIILTTLGANDSLVLRESATGDLKLKLKHVTANDTKVFDFSGSPMIFGQGIFVDSISDGATAMLILSSGGQ